MGIMIMYWINFLHLYQPANSDDYKIREATEKSYLRIVRALEENDRVKFTLNISGCLVLRWQEMHYNDLLRRIANLVKLGKIELVCTAAYHPLLPLVHANEARLQIKENEEILRKFFGVDLKLRGFFLPEMAFSAEVAKIVKEFGYEWLILDEISSATLQKINYNKKYFDASSGLGVVFRSRAASRKYVPDYLLAQIKKGSAKDYYVTATDGELYGLRHIDHTSELEKILKREELSYKTISEYLSDLKTSETISLRPSTWESEEEDLRKNNPYKLWNNKHNKIQTELWRLVDFVSTVIEENKTDENYIWARWHFVRGLASCTFWWASSHDFKLFSTKAWSPDEIEKGLNDLIRAVRSLSKAVSSEKKLLAEKYNLKIRKMIWERHWKTEL